MTIEVGSVINGRYLIEEIIAKGGMGAVYRAMDESLNIPIAIKENFFNSEEHSRQFKREATLLASLRHPNLPRVTDHFVIPNQGQYLVMDFIAGEDLRQRLARTSAVPEDEVIQIGVAIASALSYLHSRVPPIVHRDIKPGNIKITPTGQVVLVDFGLAKQSQSGVATTLGAQGLTPGYAPPEQYGKGTEPRSDIYSLGATLYAALTGKIPEDALNRAMGTRQLVPIRSFNPRVSPNVASVIEKAMSVDPVERYQNGDDFAKALLAAKPGSGLSNSDQTVTGTPDMLQKSAISAALHTVVSSTPAVSPLPSYAPQTVVAPQTPPQAPMNALPVYAPPAKKKTPVLAIVGGGVILLAIAGALFYFTRPNAASTSTATVAALIPPTNAPTQPLAPTEAVTQPAVETPTIVPAAITYSPGEGQVAFVSDRDNKVPQIYLLDTQTKETRKLTNLVDGACQPAWSPDGLNLVVTSPCSGKDTGKPEDYRNSSLSILHFKDNHLTDFTLETLDTVPGGDFDPSFSSDGTKLAFSSLRGDQTNLVHVYMNDLAQKKVDRMPYTEAYDRFFKWSPDMNFATMESLLNGHAVVVLIDFTAKRTWLVNNEGFTATAVFSRDSSTVYFKTGDGTHIGGQKVTLGAQPFEIIRTPGQIQNMTISQDGNYLVFQVENKLYRVGIDGKGLVEIPGATGNEKQPAWRPQPAK